MLFNAWNGWERRGYRLHRFVNAVTRDHGNIWMLHRFCHLEHKFFCIQEDAFEEKSCYPFSILNLCSAPSRQRFRSAPNVGATSGKRKQFVKFIKKDLDKSRGRERRSEWRFFQRDGPTIDKALFCLMAVRATIQVSHLIICLCSYQKLE